MIPESLMPSATVIVSPPGNCVLTGIFEMSSVTFVFESYRNACDMPALGGS